MLLGSNLSVKNPKTVKWICMAPLGVLMLGLCLLVPATLSKVISWLPDEMEYSIGYTQGYIARTQKKHVCLYDLSAMSSKEMEGFLSGIFR